VCACYRCISFFSSFGLLRDDQSSGVDVGSVPGKIGRGVILGTRCIAACDAEVEGWNRFSRGEGRDIFV